MPFLIYTQEYKHWVLGKYILLYTEMERQELSELFAT
jgi:hypothetical protein